MVIRFYKAGSTEFVVYVRHASKLKLGSRVKRCKDKQEVKVFVEEQIDLEEGLFSRERVC